MDNLHRGGAHRSHLSRLRAPHPKDDIRLLLPTEENRVLSERTGRPSYRFFESVEECRKLDAERLRKVDRALHQVTSEEQHAALVRLRETLDYDPEGKPPESRASAVYMRWLRPRLAGEILRLRRRRYPDMMGIHIVPNLKWDLGQDELVAREFRRRLKELNNYLKADAFKGANGFVILGLDGEVRARTGLASPHCHGVVAGEFADLIREHLKPKRAFRPRGAGHAPIRIQAIKQPATQISYTMKNRWTYRYMTIDAFGDIKGEQKSLSMPEPYSSLYLAALNDLGVGETFLMRNCRIERGRIVVNGD